ncbi:DNA internalization-related competence protein ComEC/Rec2 [Paenibacillus sp. YPG26]|uniref:DNA internalization-related competence protein ComEC/Rec2 n=1 Tax=Paenibacillus sp. YPG26 TaxID=2878915 RepID=UPI00203ECE9E|nr:DNA internalization-related competence protein ComEC/Rec2 [Paenibacillus sp. YPG26]USB34417.1 DNA internalization-related competence protein ComEC/Rec2 [Paenibacillus sp. YPG26]
MARRPLVTAACLWIVGSVMASQFHNWSFWLLWAGLSLAFPLISYLSRWTWKQTMICWLVVSASALYWNYNEFRNVSAITDILDTNGIAAEEAVISKAKGVIISAPETDGDRTDFRIKLTDLSIDGPGGKSLTDNDLASEKVIVQVRLLREEELILSKKWTRGQHVTLTSVSLTAPAPARNFGGFDYSEYLHREHIHWLFKVKGAAHVQTTEANWSFAAIMAWNDQLRNTLASRIGQLFKEPSAGFMQGLLIGVTDGLDPETYSSFTQLGLTHILAISGGHVAINMGILFWLLRRFKVTKEKAYLVVLIFIPFYVLLTGFTPSVVRSGIMSMLGVYLLRKGLFKDTLNILAAAALCMLMWEPYFLYNVSFQLSFIVTAGLIVLVPLVNPLLTFLPGKVRTAASMTIVAQIVSFPLTIYYFNQFSLLSLAANFIIVPIVGVFSLSAGTAALLLSLIWLQLGRWAAYPAHFMNELAFMAASWMSGRSGFTTIWKSPAVGWIAVYYILIGWFLYLGARRAATEQSAFGYSIAGETQPLVPDMLHSSRFGVRPSRHRLSLFTAGQLLSCCGLLGLLAAAYQPENPHNIGTVQFLDVGQGDCTLITTPEGRNILVDGGGTVTFGKPKEAWRNKKEPYEVGAKVVVPLLKRRGIHRLDAIILTHGDQDHAGGLQAVMESIPVNALFINGTLADSKTMKTLIHTALDKEIKLYSISGGMRIKPDSRTVLAFLAPVQPAGLEEEQVPFVKEQNHVSIAFLIEMDGARFLFTGDMDAASEKDVIRQLGSSKVLGLPGVLKVAHHGSHTSTSEAWLDFWSPQAAVISAGVSNSYGHPHPDTMDKLQKRGINIHRTDEMGEIQMQVRKGNIVTRHKL